MATTQYASRRKRSQEAWRSESATLTRDLTFESAMDDALAGIPSPCCTVPCATPSMGCFHARPLRASIRRLTWALADAGLRQPTNKAQERLSHALNLLDRATSIPAALSVDGEGGLFAEWIAGGVRLTVEVDKLGEIDWLVVKPHHDAVSVTLTDFFVLLRQLDAAIARAHAANH